LFTVANIGCLTETTKKIDNINCTTDDNLCLQDIGALSTMVSYVVAIFTGPICALYNTFTKQHVKKWFLITTNGVTYTHEHIDNDSIKDGNLSSIYAYFKNLKV
jgi:hypothetical protein